MKIKILTATQVKALKYNGGGSVTRHAIDTTCKLYLFCAGSGAKTYKFRKSGSTYENIGDYDNISLAEAREKAKEFYKAEAAGELIAKESKSVSEVFFMWLDNVKIPQNTQNRAEKRRKLINRVNKWLLKPLGDKPVGELKKADIVKQTTQAGLMSYTTAVKFLPILRDTLKYAKANGYIKEYSFALELIDDAAAIYPKSGVTHRKAVIDEDRLRDIIGIVKRSELKRSIKNLFFLSLVTAQRPHQIRNLTWDAVDLEKGFLNFSETDNKTRLNARIPLPKQAVAILEDQLKFKENDYVFSSAYFTPKSGWALSENVLQKAIKSLGIDDLHAHGFRSMFSTFATRASERVNGEVRAKFEKRIIDEVLLHTPKSEVDKAYFRDFNSSEHLRLLQWWADFLAGLGAFD